MKNGIAKARASTQSTRVLLRLIRPRMGSSCADLRLCGKRVCAGSVVLPLPPSTGGGQARNTGTKERQGGWLGDGLDRCRGHHEPLEAARSTTEAKEQL